MKRIFKALALITTQSAQAWAECGNLCDLDWWKTATTSDVKAKLDAGADVIARGEEGVTPLHFAAVFGLPENIQALLEAGTDVMARNVHGETPLHLAAWMGEKSGVIESLLEAGSDPKAINGYGETPWDSAKGNDALNNTKSYWALNDARYNQARRD